MNYFNREKLICKIVYFADLSEDFSLSYIIDLILSPP